MSASRQDAARPNGRVVPMPGRVGSNHETDFEVLPATPTNRRLRDRFRLPSPRWTGLLAFLSAVSLGCSVLRADDGEQSAVRITPRDQSSTVFGDSQAKQRFDVAARQQFDGVFRWSFSANGRTIEAGESAVRLAAGGSATVAVPLRVPAVNAGVIFDAQLAVSLAARGREPTASLTRPIRIFPRNPFFGRTKWLEKLSIALFDPSGETAQLFEKASIPFERIRNSAALDNVETGLLVVGEGASFARNRSLPAALTAAAARGVPVLCLAAGDGQLVLPIAGDENRSTPNRIVFGRNDVINELDKRLDARQWMSADEIAISRINLRTTGGRIVGEVSEAGRGWPWIELRFQENIRLVYCGFGVVRHWEDGPTPRFLLARLFEHLTDQEGVRSQESESRILTPEP